jgi:hypothetical protein
MGNVSCTTGSLPFFPEHVRNAENAQRGAESFASMCGVSSMEINQSIKRNPFSFCSKLVWMAPF